MLEELSSKLTKEELSKTIDVLVCGKVPGEISIISEIITYIRLM